MHRLPGIILLLMLVVANVANASGENIDNGFQAENCDDELDETEHEVTRYKEQRARPPKKPFCERTRKKGWGGKCSIYSKELVGYRCDFFWNNTNSPVYPRLKQLCYGENEACCVDCSSPVQTDICWKSRNKSFARATCCPSELQVAPALKSGCVCCKHCKRKHGCRNSETGQKGWCVTSHDPVRNTSSCLNLGGRIKKRACRGFGCFCCVPPTVTPTPVP